MNSSSRIIKTVRKLATPVITIGIFAAATAFALILARGNTITEAGISPTGTVRLVSNSYQGLKVTLDGQPRQISSSNIINNIIPGTYTLEISKPKYNNWIGEVKVSEGLVTDVAFQLFPTELALEQIDSKEISQIFFSPDKSKMVYVVGSSQIGTNIGFWQLDLTRPVINFGGNPEEFKIANLNSALKLALAGEGIEAKISPNNQKIALFNSPNEIYVLDLGRFNDDISSQKIDISYPISDFNWMNGSDNLALLSNDLLINYQISSQVETIISFDGENHPIYDSNSSGVTALKKGQIQKYTSQQGNPVELENITLPKGITNIRVPSINPAITYLETENEVYYLNSEQSILRSIGNVEILSISPNGEYLLVKESEQIKSISVKVSRVLDKVEINKQNTTLPLDIDIASITWDANSSFIIFTSDEKSNSLLTADRKGNNIQELINEIDLQIVDYDSTPSGDKLIILLNNGLKQSLYQLDIAGE